MKIVICSSIQFYKEIGEVAKSLEEQDHEVTIPLSAQDILNGELTLEDFNREKVGSEGVERKMKYDVIKRYYQKIQESDSILVLNYAKNGIDNYIGGNTFLEMGFAHVLDKQIFLMNSIPDQSYSDEIKAMQPIILYCDLSRIRNLG